MIGIIGRDFGIFRNIITRNRRWSSVEQILMFTFGRTCRRCWTIIGLSGILACRTVGQWSVVWCVGSDGMLAIIDTWNGGFQITIEWSSQHLSIELIFMILSDRLCHARESNLNNKDKTWREDAFNGGDENGENTSGMGSEQLLIRSIVER